MALIRCPECGKEISDRAQACIHCGYPMELIQARLEEERPLSGPYSVVLKSCRYNWDLYIPQYAELAGVSQSEASKKFYATPSLLFRGISQEEAQRLAGQFDDKDCDLAVLPNEEAGKLVRDGRPAPQQDPPKNSESLSFGGVVLAVIVAVIILSFL